jgi:hypothetical protein
MNFSIVATESFERKLKRLAKKHKSIGVDLMSVVNELGANPTLGTQITTNVYKIRIAITSKGKGKSGGLRIITLVRIIKNTVYLIDIYDKSEQENISTKELKKIIDSFINE